MSAKARAEEWAAKQSGDTSLAAEKNQERRERAIKWVDKEIRKLISEILRIAPSRSIAYGPLFAETANTFEALSGTLVAAKKRGVVEYDGQLLLQRVHDHVIIKLLKTEIEDTPIPKETPRPIKISSNTSGFDTVDPNAPVNCATCNKRVYPTERLAAAGKVYHSEGCFVCAHCKGILRSTEFCSVNGKVYCQPHYLELFKQKGGFSFGDDGDSAAKKSPQIAPTKTPAKPVEPITTKPQGSPTLPARNHAAHKDKPLPTPSTNSAPSSKPTSTVSSANSSTSSSPALTPASLSPAATPPPAKKTISALKPATTANTTECSKCKATLTATAKFCVSCGTPTIPATTPSTSSTSSSSSPPRTCNTCHKEINAATKFCPHCGEKCNDAAPPASASSTVSASTPASIPASTPAPAAKPATTSTNAPALAPRPHLKESPKQSPVPSPQASPKTQPKELLKSLPTPTLSSFGSSSSTTTSTSSSSSSSSNVGKTLPTPDAALASLSLKDKEKEQEKEKEKPKDDKPSLLSKPLPIPNSSPSSSSVSSGASSPSSLSPSTSTSALSVPSPSSSLEPPPSPSTTSVRRPPKMPPALKSSPSFSATDRDHSRSMGSIPPLGSTASWPNRSLPQPGGTTSPPANKNRSVSYATTATTSVATSSIVDSVSRKHQTTARLIEYLLMNGTYETGIFKTNYNPEEEASLNKAITSGVASNINLSEYTISTIASCLKRLLRSSYPLFPSKHYDQLIRMGSHREIAAKIIELTALVESLPRDHRAVLAELFMLLSAIADHSNSTMMDAKTLAYTFGPLLIVPKGLKIDIKDAVNEQRICNDLVLDMIENSDSIFEAPDDNVKWVPDEDVKKCTKCNGNFGLILRKKRCKVCGYMFCSKCSSKKVDGRRACDECYELQH